MSGLVDESGAKLDTPEEVDAVSATAPPAKPKRRRMKRVMVLHHISQSTKLYAIMHQRSTVYPDEYYCKFFDTQADAEAWLEAKDEPCALFVVRPILPA